MSFRAFAFASLLSAACASHLPPVALKVATPAPSALNEAIEAFYKATDVKGLEVAVVQAEQAAPESAGYHELAERLAFLRGLEPERVDHLLLALADLGNVAAPYHFELLADLSLTQPQRDRYEELLQSLSQDHPSPALRTRAAEALALSCHVRGDRGCLKTAQERLGPMLPLALIGAWDNDQGKGFDMRLPPEDAVDFKTKYDGAVVKVGWRSTSQADYRGQLSLSDAFTPSRWAVAYAAGAVKAPADGDYELRVSSSDGVKVWVNGTEMFSARLVNAFLFDQFVIPVRLRAGANAVLIKSAHGEGEWALRVRFTRKGGDAATELSALPSDAPAALKGVPPGKPVDFITLIRARVEQLPEGSARRAYHAAQWVRQSVSGSDAVNAAQSMLAAAPGSVAASELFASTVWEHGDRDKTADVLGTLASTYGRDLPMFQVAQARFWRQQGLKQKSREALLGVTSSQPEVSAAWRELAALFENEGWTEDRCNALSETDRRWPKWTAVQLELASCFEGLRLRDRAAKLYEGLIDVLPHHAEVLRRSAELLSSEEDLSRARKRLLVLTEAFPTWSVGWLRLAEIYRREGNRPAAEEALARLLTLNPDSVEARLGLAAIAYQAGDRTRALDEWQQALERNPDDERLANRLAYLAPVEGGSWARDVPSEKELDAIVASRASVSAVPGANVAYLLDHEVSQLKSDGSTVNLVTLIAHALNQEGRDRIMVQHLAPGRPRILHAYAVDPAGRRAEASSLRGREVRYRGLQVGSTIVLQYRLDVAPVGYLAKHLARSFSFQGVNDQRSRSEWILYLPKGTQLHERKVGEFLRQETDSGDQTRVAYLAKDVAPVLPEPDMPTGNEVLANIAISTVPDWDTFLKWEEALLQDAFRDSPELNAVAKRLFAGVDSQQEKINRLHTFLMEEIRYQQDYENFIAGVKPHAAPVVLQRGYGDCKDKAVLFIALAKKAGIDVKFADVRTRPRGPVMKDIPMQQFDHAIVYVPAQKGIAQARFYDPTADMLDVESLRDDDVGTQSLTLDPFSGKFGWHEIPYQAPEMNLTQTATRIEIAKDGSATGTLQLSGVGSTGSGLRRGARNPEALRKGLQHMVSNGFSGGTLKKFELVDLRKPAVISVAFDAPSLVRKEGTELRLKVPIDWNPQRRFALSERKFSLLLGAPSKYEWSVELKAPEGMMATRVPTSATVDAGCLRLSRTVTPAPGVLRIQQSLTQTCERIPAQEYPAARAKAEKMGQLMDEEVVFAPEPLKKKKGVPTANR
ncbi:MAG: tetratricopeptide repeat protein [Myxococcaceae bacterium]